MQGGGGERKERREKKIKIKNREFVYIRIRASHSNIDRIGGVSFRWKRIPVRLFPIHPQAPVFLSASFAMV
jgi:hypothetical protein